jgi:hypothetical protein
MGHSLRILYRCSVKGISGTGFVIRDGGHPLRDRLRLTHGSWCGSPWGTPPKCIHKSEPGVGRYGIVCMYICSRYVQYIHYIPKEFIDCASFLVDRSAEDGTRREERAAKPPRSFRHLLRLCLCLATWMI